LFSEALAKESLVLRSLGKGEPCSPKPWQRRALFSVSAYLAEKEGLVLRIHRFGGKGGLILPTFTLEQFSNFKKTKWLFVETSRFHGQRPTAAGTAPDFPDIIFWITGFPFSSRTLEKRSGKPARAVQYYDEFTGWTNEVFNKNRRKD
jgi:hypothetical protein